MKTATRSALLLALLALALTVICAPAQAGTYVLKFNHVLGAKEPYHQGFLNWAKAVQEKTKGGLKIEGFPSAQLGVEEDIIEQIRQGANIGQNTDSARMGNYVPGIAIMNGPYFVENLAEVAKLKDSPTVRGFLDELASKEPARVLKLPRAPGAREARWAHLLCGEVAFDMAAAPPAEGGVSAGEIAALKAEQSRLAAELAQLRALVQRISAELGIDAG